MKAPNALRRFGPPRAAVSLLCACAFLGVASMALASPGPTPQTSPDAVHQALAEGRYAEAEAGYEALIRERGYSAPLLYDLGNAYLRGGKPTPALLAYERARLLAPRDGAIAANLASARAALGVPLEDSPIGRFARSLSANTWAWLAAGAFWLTAATVGAALLSKRRRAPMLAGAALAVTVGGLAGVALRVESRYLEHGLVMAAAPVLVSPFESAQSGFSLAPGDDVQLGRSRGEYVFVSDAQGRSGWIERARVAPLIPVSS